MDSSTNGKKTQSIDLTRSSVDTATTRTEYTRNPESGKSSARLIKRKEI